MQEEGSRGGEAPLLRQFAAWIDPGLDLNDAVKRDFYTSAVVIPDANVLLDLYQYTPATRAEFLVALQSISSRLWLPHQVGLEFVRGRVGVIKRRNEVLSRAPAEVNQAFASAWKQIDATANRIKALVVRFAGPDRLGEIDGMVSRDLFEEAVGPWKTALIEQAKRVKSDYDIDPAEFSGGADELLAQVADLFGDRLGSPITEEVLRSRVARAVQFRYPNEIPPGFSDRGKPNDLLAAGDFLIWEEMVEYARTLPPASKAIFVSGDTKEDWYQQADVGRRKRPWPYLVDEFRLRAGGELLIVETAEFYSDIRKYLGADIATSSIEEAIRPAPQPGGEAGDYLDPEILGELDPPDVLIADALLSARVSSRGLRLIARDDADRLFQWWLIAATGDLRLRERQEAEPRLGLRACLPEEDANRLPSWVRAGDVLSMGEFPYLSMYFAPWFARVITTCSPADRRSLLRIAHQHGSITDFGENDLST